MNENFVSYQMAMSLKEAGFNETSLGKFVDCPHDPTLFYGMIYEPWNLDKNEILAPSLWQAAKWLRDAQGIAINVIAHDGGVYDYDIVFLPNAVDCDCPIDRATFSRTYEEALSEGITSVLELIKKARNLFRRNSDFF